MEPRPRSPRSGKGDAVCGSLPPPWLPVPLEPELPELCPLPLAPEFPPWLAEESVPDVAPDDWPLDWPDEVEDPAEPCVPVDPVLPMELAAPGSEVLVPVEPEPLDPVVEPVVPVEPEPALPVPCDPV